MKSKGSSRDEGRFELPSGVSFAKGQLLGGWAYVFRHETLGLLGRILLQDTGDGRSRVTCELAGDPADPMTANRAEVFKPLGLELAHRLESRTGTVPEDLAAPPPPPPTPHRELVESQVIPCDRCGTPVAMLIFAPEATDPGRFEDYARKMFAEYSRMDVPTWVIGPAPGEGPPEDRPADILKVWPKRAPAERLRPVEFNPIIEQLATGHCRRLRRVVSGGQTGADQAGLRAARALGIETGGWAPLGWETEEGPAPWLSESGLRECPKKGYPARTEANARDSDGTLWFGSTDSTGFRATIAACRKHEKPYLIVEDGVTRPSDVVSWLAAHRVEALNVAGNRESKNPGLGRRVEAFLACVIGPEGPRPQ